MQDKIGSRTTLLGPGQGSHLQPQVAGHIQSQQQVCHLQTSQAVLRALAASLLLRSWELQALSNKSSQRITDAAALCVQDSLEELQAVCQPPVVCLLPATAVLLWTLDTLRHAVLGPVYSRLPVSQPYKTGSNTAFPRLSRTHPPCAVDDCKRNAHLHLPPTPRSSRVTSASTPLVPSHCNRQTMEYCIT